MQMADRNSPAASRMIRHRRHKPEEHAALLDVVLDHTADGVIIADSTGRLRRMNARLPACMAAPWTTTCQWQAGAGGITSSESMGSPTLQSSTRSPALFDEARSW
jgi:hypothetical protein